LRRRVIHPAANEDGCRLVNVCLNPGLGLQTPDWTFIGPPLQHTWKQGSGLHYKGL
jgi:hypothetical protein